jgi:hypothetical protein
MYETFDAFGIPGIPERFCCALDRMVFNPSFNADKRGEYIDQKRQARLSMEDYERARAHYVDAASAVSEFLRFTGRLQLR